MIGGRAILALDPAALPHLVGDRVVALVSGTNGKTTTTSLLGAATAGAAGHVTTNVLGANQPPGLAAALAAGEPGGAAVLEVDEAWLGRVVEETGPAVVLLLNLSRDQLDRNNEVRQLAARWRTTFSATAGTATAGTATAGTAAAGTATAGTSETAGPQVVANADDPIVAWSAMAAPAVTWVAAGQPWKEDASGCPNCGGRIIFGGGGGGPDGDGVPGGGGVAAGGAAGVGGGAAGVAGGAAGVGGGAARETVWGSLASGAASGGWHCSGCDLRRPALDAWLEGDELVSVEGWRIRLRLALPGRANRANAGMALIAARHLGVDPAIAASAMAGATEIVGRYSVVEVGDTRARLLLAKNPAGWLEVLDVLRPGPEPVVVAINARIADGRDPSWLWDVPFERLAGRLVIASGERGRDLAVRLRYAEVEHRLVLDPLEAVSVAGEIERQRRADSHAAQESETLSSLRGQPRHAPAVVAARAWANARRAREDAGLPPPGWAGAVEIDVVGNYTSFQTLRTRLGR